MQQQARGFLEVLADNDQKLLEQVNGVRQLALTDGALSAKVKTLMTMLCDALLAHPEGVATIAQRARAAGATEQEIAETVQVAFLMGGLPGLVSGCQAFRQ